MQFLPVFVITALFSLLAIRLYRGAPATQGSERWLAAFFAAFGFAIPTRMLAVSNGFDVSGNAVYLNVLGHSLLSLSTICFVVFLWRVFREREAWAKALCLTIIATQTLGLLAFFALGGHRDEGSDAVLAINLSRAFPFAWAFVESFLYYGMMARRQSLGMGDAVITNRFLLFSVWNAALFVLPFTLAFLRVYARFAGMDDGGGHGVSLDWAVRVMRVCILVFGLTASVGMWLSFFPPKRYLARFQAPVAAS